MIVYLFAQKSRYASPLRARTKLRARGVVFLEAALVLPLFVLLLTGFLYVSRATDSALKSHEEARYCAFLSSTRGCDPLPDFCSSTSERSEDVEDLSEITRPLSTNHRIAEDILGILESGLELVAPPRKRARAVVSFRRPSLFGGALSEARAENRVPCRSAMPTPEQVAERAFSAITGVE